MPNCITNRLAVTGPAKIVEEFKAAIFVQEEVQISSRLRAEAASGDKEKAAAALASIKEIESEPRDLILDFNRILPAPAFVGDRGGVRDREKWNLEWWGSKYNVCSFEILCDEPEKLVVMFDAAWYLPTGIFKTLAYWFPELSMVASYFEEGHSFWGEDFKETGAREFVEHCHTDRNAGDEARALWKRLCIELKDYDPEEEEDDDE